MPRPYQEHRSVSQAGWGPTGVLGGACGHRDVALGNYLLLYHLLHLEVLLFLLK